jgi:hypothetical protein
MMREHVIDGFALILAEPPQHNEIGVPARQKQLGDDLVGAAQVDQLDLGKIQ